MPNRIMDYSVNISNSYIQTRGQLSYSYAPLLIYERFNFQNIVFAV